MTMNQKEQSFVDHLEELRKRLIICISAVILISCASYSLTDDAIDLMKKDLLGGYPGVKVIVTTPMEAVLAQVELSLLFGVYLSLPVIIYQLFAFMSPALYPQERKAIMLSMPGPFILFTAGALFSYLVLLPIMMHFLLEFSMPIAEPLLKLSELISFIFLIMLTMGLIFQWPLITAILSYLGLASPRFWIERTRYAILFCFVLSAIATPDPSFITQILMAIPMIILYGVGIITAQMIWKEKKP